MAIKVRLSEERGFFDYEWLKTYYTFSFGEYEDSNYNSFHSLRVLNECWIRPGVGFPLHTNHDIEILSVVIEGAIAYQDSSGHGSILQPGAIQLSSTGTGITYTELNGSDREEAHFFQIWLLPNKLKLKPYYQEKFIPISERHNKWCLIFSEDGRENSLSVNQNALIYHTILERENEKISSVCSSFI